MLTKVGVMGSAGGELSPEVIARVRRLGAAIARAKCVMITGACPGLPHEAVLGAKEVGVLVVGVSPGHCLAEHIELYHSPYEEYDIMIFTGSGLMGREIEAIRSCDIVIIVGGRSGTLGEFAIAFDEGKLIGVLRGTGGIADHIADIVSFIQKETDAEVIYSEDPEELVKRCLAAHQERLASGLAHRMPRADG